VATLSVATLLAPPLSSEAYERWILPNFLQRSLRKVVKIILPYTIMSKSRIRNIMRRTSKVTGAIERGLKQVGTTVKKIANKPTNFFQQYVESI
jgi:hypothetical protein